MTDKPGDIVSDFLRRVRPHVTLDQWHRLALELRDTWGGRRVYIPKAPGDVTCADRERPKRGPCDP
jgi:hypothetical protein